ncbi:TetR-like C-terminal domain-containing protein [Nocardia asteroides]|uniref:TetR-like C-terminal domain-containing protein n=1 Tax=Nocardia asteroides TaxID=1824 RepID=UPI001E573CB3|nr:TetR-like C-terminal domain-containing protein [Nocardia asteroides]UGT55917.1 TetR/AcrR family transcriptional regulator C-terminal ligand-binding domain-containing protein [Nocardia asteroides]
MITRAIDRGELPGTTDPQLAVEMLVTPLHFKVIFTREPLDPSSAERIVDTLLSGLTKPAPAGRDSRGTTHELAHSDRGSAE